MRGITIIGGGLAGLSIGTALRRHDVPVCVKEAGDYPRHRVCGEFISGLSRETIDSLGVRDCFRDAVILRKVAWFDTKQKLRVDWLPRKAMGLSRWALDQNIADKLIDLGGELNTGTRCDRKQAAAGVVDCAGRVPQTESPWMGLKCHVDGFMPEADLEMHMSPGGYVGMSRVENGRFNLCGLFRNAGLKPDAGVPLIFRYLGQCGFDELLSRLDRSQVIEKSGCSVAAISYKPKEPRNDVALLGDACGLIPPFTGNGMTMAFQHAELALEPLVRYARAKISWGHCLEEINRLSRRRFTRRLRVARGFHHLLTSRRLFPMISAFARLPGFPFKSLYRLTR